jgi:hypothetical protein
VCVCQPSIDHRDRGRIRSEPRGDSGKRLRVNAYLRGDEPEAFALSYLDEVQAFLFAQQARFAICELRHWIRHNVRNPSGYARSRPGYGSM